MLPETFRPLLWSYKFEEIDPLKHKREIVVNAINYGDLSHWRWLVEFYGQAKVKSLISSLPATELKPRARRLAGYLFHIPSFQHAS